MSGKSQKVSHIYESYILTLFSTFEMLNRLNKTSYSQAWP